MNMKVPFWVFLFITLIFSVTAIEYTPLDTSWISNYSGDFQIMHNFTKTTILLNGTTEITDTNDCYKSTEDGNILTRWNGTCTLPYSGFFPNVTTFTSGNFTCGVAVNSTVSAGESRPLWIHDSDVGFSVDTGIMCFFYISGGVLRYTTGMGTSAFSPSLGSSSIGGMFLKVTADMDNDMCGYEVLWTNNGSLVASAYNKAFWNAASDHPKVALFPGDPNSFQSLDELRCWNSTNGNAIPQLAGSPPPPPPPASDAVLVNSSWLLILGYSGIADIWNTGGNANVTDDIISFTVLTNVTSNMSCSKFPLSYSDMLDVSPSFKASTTNTLNHSFTVYGLSQGQDYCLYCSFATFEGLENSNHSDSGCLSFSVNMTGASSYQCPTSSNAVAMLYIFFMLAFALMILGLLTRFYIFGVIGGIMILVSSWNIAPCNGLIGLCLFWSGILLSLFFGYKQVT